MVGQTGGDSVEVKGGQSTQKTAAELGLLEQGEREVVFFIRQATSFIYLQAGEGVHLTAIMRSMVTWV